MRVAQMLVILLIAGSALARAQCVAESTTTRPHLVELYSSEGCSSCPPAEAWLRTLHAGAEVVPLEFHVDYWDDLGWRDRFSDARYTARQQAIAARDGGSAVYTPQLVLDGRSWAGWYRGGHLAPAPATDATMTLNVTTAAGVHVRVRTNPGSVAEAGALRNFLALTEDHLSTSVRAGENRGATLQHDHVVRAFAGPLPLADSTVDLALPKDLDLAHASVVAFAQNPHDGAVAQVAIVALAQCH
jgi:hypothetical protein